MSSQTMSSQTNGKLSQILLVEDNPADVRLMAEALKENGVDCKMSVVKDGVEAMAFLHQKDEYANAPRPDLILLDLNLPRKNGREVLVTLKENTNLRRIPVVVLTISKAEEDILKAYDHHVNCYVTKPIDLDQFLSVAKFIRDFWLTVVTLPPGS